MKIHTTGVHEDLGETGRTPRAHFAQDALAEVQDTRPDREAPALISETMVRLVEGEDGGVGRLSRVAHEASGGMRIETDHEEERKMVRVPERLKALCTDLVMGGGVHEDHDQKHEVPRDASSLLIVNVEGDLGPDLCGRNTVSLRAATKAHVVTYGYAQR